MEAEIEKATWEKEEAEAEVEIWKYAFGFVELAVVKCAIELGIADAIERHGSPMTLSELSSTLGCVDPSLLNRMMRFLTHRNIFKCVAPTAGYAQTPLSRRLMRNGKHSMAAFILLQTSPTMLAGWQRLSDRVLDNNKSTEDHHHLGLFGNNDDEFKNLFHEAMACDAEQIVHAIMEGCREAFDGVRSLVDVGGGNGTTLRFLTQACPWIIRGINFDLSHAIVVAPICDGVEHVIGDMFLSVPKADAAFLKEICHNWGDEECIKILKNCKEAIPKENGKVIIVDQVIEEGSKDGIFKDAGLMLDMIMMAHTNSGKERTLKEWEYAIKMAGFSSYTVNSIHALQSVIIAFY